MWVHALDYDSLPVFNNSFDRQLIILQIFSKHHQSGNDNDHGSGVVQSEANGYFIV